MKSTYKRAMIVVPALIVVVYLFSPKEKEATRTATTNVSSSDATPKESPFANPDGTKTVSDAIDVMMLAFDGNPTRDELNSLLRKLVNYYDEAEHDYDSYLGIGNAMVSMCNKSKIGLTEMELLRKTVAFSKGASQNGKVKTMKLGEAIGMTAAFIELGEF